MKLNSCLIPQHLYRLREYNISQSMFLAAGDTLCGYEVVAYKRDFYHISDLLQSFAIWASKLQSTNTGSLHQLITYILKCVRLVNWSKCNGQFNFHQNANEWLQTVINDHNKVLPYSRNKSFLALLKPVADLFKSHNDDELAMLMTISLLH